MLCLQVLRGFVAEKREKWPFLLVFVIFHNIGPSEFLKFLHAAIHFYYKNIFLLDVFPDHSFVD